MKPSVVHSAVSAPVYMLAIAAMHGTMKLWFIVYLHSIVITYTVLL
jgi:hypothetical protein